MIARVFAAALVVLVAFGCSAPPTTSTALNDAALAPVLTPTQDAATHDEVRFSFDLVNDPEDCTDSRVGEVLLFTGRVTIVSRFTTNNSGNVNRRGEIIFDPASRTVGAESGEVWMIDATSSGSANHVNIHGDGRSGQNTIHEFYTNLDGDHLHVRSDVHFTFDANGNIRAFRGFEFTCILGG